MRSRVRPGGLVWGTRFRKDRGDIGVVKKAGGRGTAKKTQPGQLPQSMLFPTAAGQARWRGCAFIRNVSDAL